MILSTNDKTIKLWKITNKSVKKSEKFPSWVGMNLSNLKMPRLKALDETFCP